MNSPLTIYLHNMKKIFRLFLLIGIVLSMGSCGKGNSNSDEKELDNLSSQVNKALEDEDFAQAYSLLDPWFNRHDKYNVRRAAFSLNERVLKNELGLLVKTDNQGDNASKIVFAINERAKYNNSDAYSLPELYEKGQVNKMFKFAYDLAEMEGDQILAEKLKSRISDE